MYIILYNIHDQVVLFEIIIKHYCILSEGGNKMLSVELIYFLEFLIEYFINKCTPDVIVSSYQELFKLI
jgi:hypothetical protein